MAERPQPERVKSTVYPKIGRRGYIKPRLGNEQYGRQRTLIPRTHRVQGSDLAEKYVSGHSTNPAGRPRYTVEAAKHAVRAPSRRVAGLTTRVVKRRLGR